MKKGLILYVIAAAFIAVFPVSIHAGGASQLSASEGREKASLYDGREYVVYLDESRNMTVGDIAVLDHSEWTVARGALTVRQSEARLWVKVPFVPDSPGDYYMTEHFGIDEFEVWVLEDRDADPVYAGRSGWLLDKEESADSSRLSFSSVPLGDLQDRPVTVYMSIATVFAVSPHFILMTEEAHRTACVRSASIQGLSAGFSLITIIFALVVFVSSPRREYAVFLLLSLATALNVLYYSGFGPLILWKGIPAVSEIVRLTAPLLFFAISARFFRSILLLSPRPVLEKMLSGLEYALYAAVLIVQIVPDWIGFIVANFTVLVALFVLFFLLVTAEMKKMTISAMPLIAWGILVAAGIFLSFEYAGLIPFLEGLDNNNHILSGALLVMSAMFGATIVAQSEYSRTYETIRRIKAEAHSEKAREHLVDSDRMDGLASSVSIIAHEMGGPLGSARLLGSEMEIRAGEFSAGMDEGKKGPEEIKGFLEFAEDAGRMISETIRNAGVIMDGFKTFTADQATVRRQTVDVGEYVERLSGLFRLKIARTPHTLEVDSPPGMVINTVPGYVSQILTNLVNNALNHAFGKGSAGTVSILVERGEGESVEVTVSDDGSGVPEDELERIFEMFYTTAADRDGTGLGLAISRHLAETELDGNLEVVSTPGEGTAFRLTLGNLTTGHAEYGDENDSA